MTHPYPEDDKALVAIQARHPGWDIVPGVTVWIAVPAGTPVHRAAFLQTMNDKLTDAGPPPAHEPPPGPAPLPAAG